MKGREFIQNYLIRFEPLLFWSGACLIILPIWLATGIYTYDGPAHLYNARQLWEILFENNAWLTNFYALNSGLDNWLVHGMLMFLQAAFGAVLAEKLWLSFYVLVFIYGFRQWMLYMQQTALSWWVFALPYFFNLLMGQYSFALSVALLPYFIRHWELFLLNSKTKSLLWAALFLLLLYLTHMVSFGLAGLAASLLSCWRNTSWQIICKNLVSLAGISLPGILLAWLFVSRNADAAANQWLPMAERLQYLLDGRSLIGYSYTEDVSWTRLLMAVFAFLLVIGLWKNRQQAWTTWIWLVIWLVVLLLYLVAPDQAAGGGFIQTRLHILWLLFGIVLLASLQKMQLWYALTLPLVLLMTIRLGAIHYTANENLAAYRADWEKVAAFLPAESSAATFNYSPLWFQHHIHTLVGQDKPILHLSNYEADNNYFPLRWQSTPQLQQWLEVWAATKSMAPCGPDQPLPHKFLPDYIFCYFHEFATSQSCAQSLDKLLTDHYVIVAELSSAKLQVYQNRLSKTHAH